MKIQLYFLLDDIVLSDADQQTLISASGEWVVLLHQSGRQLIHTLVDTDVIAEIAAFLTPYNPVILGGWNVDGLPFGITSSTDTNGVTTQYGTAIYPLDTANATAFLSTLSGIHSFMLDSTTMQFIDSGIALYQTPIDLFTFHQFGGWEFPILS